MSDYVPKLIKLLQEKSIEREVKKRAILALSDTISCTGEKYLPYLEQSLKIFIEAGIKVTDLNQDFTDREYLEYMITLQTNIIDALTSICQEAQQSQQMKQVLIQDLSYLEHIFSFIVKSIDPVFIEQINSLERFKELCGLIGDIALIFPQECKQYVGHKSIQDLINYTSQQVGDEDAVHAANWCSQHVKKALSL